MNRKLYEQETLRKAFFIYGMMETLVVISTPVAPRRIRREYSLLIIMTIVCLLVIGDMYYV